MREILLAWIFLAGLWGSDRAYSATSSVLKCSGLVSELNEMKKAQTKLLQSMVNKNDSMAETLDVFSKDVEKTEARLSSKRLSLSAAAFRAHKIREMDLIRRFDLQTQKLMTQLMPCLTRPMSQATESRP
jgi:hypothetical protein